MKSYCRLIKRIVRCKEGKSARQSQKCIKTKIFARFTENFNNILKTLM